MEIKDRKAKTKLAKKKAARKAIQNVIKATELAEKNDMVEKKRMKVHEAL